MPKLSAIARAIIPGLKFWWHDRHPKASAGSADAIVLRDGDCLLASVKDGSVIGYTFDVSLSHAEFVRRDLGALPEGAWVGTIRKVGGAVVAVNSKTFFGNQLPAAPSVIDAIRRHFA